MHASQIDFVTALSAEERCPVCEELHASVDQCVCGVCATTMCADCTSLRPDASWVCSRCAEVVPGRAVPQNRGFSLRATAIGVNELVRHSYVELRREARPSSARLVAFVATLLALFARVLSQSLSRARNAAGARTEALRPRVRKLMAELSLRSSRSYSRLDALHREYGTRARGQLGAWVLSIRNIHVREQLAGMLIATALLVAVARSDSRHSR
jgi:hypothetical protein